MASLNDIPDHLLDPDIPDTFTLWLLETPIPLHTRRDLAHTWQAYMDTHLGPENWDKINNAPEPPNVLQ